MIDKPEEACLWILGLMHSGTTVVWRALARDPRFIGFDEPLTVPQDLSQGRVNSRNTLGDYLRLFDAAPADFWARFAPIHPLQELDAEFTDQQIDFLRYLLGQGPRIVINETHLHLHVQALASLHPGGRLIHLHRRASAFASSHLRPSYSREASLPRRIVRRIRHENNKQRFWSRRDFEPGLLRHEVIGNHTHSKFGVLLANEGYDAERIMQSSTLVRLLAYWHLHYHYLENNGPRIFGEQFTSLRYEDFASNPIGTMRKIHVWLGLNPSDDAVQYQDVHSPRPAFRENDRRWRKAAKIAGFSEAELETLL